MMSTADKETVSDFVMRRRFGFFELTPEFDSDGFHEYEQRLDSDTFVLLIDRIKLLNHEISKDPKLGKGFCIGHGYFAVRPIRRKKACQKSSSMRFCRFCKNIGLIIQKKCAIGEAY